MSKIDYSWIVGIYTSIAIGIFLFVFWRNAFIGIGTSNLIVMFASIVIGAPVGVIISGKITGKVHDSEFSSQKMIKGIVWAFLGIFVGLGLGFLFVTMLTQFYYGPHRTAPDGIGILMIPSMMGGAIGGAIGGYSREIKTGIVGGAIGAFFASILWVYSGFFVSVLYLGDWGTTKFTELIFEGFVFGIASAIPGAIFGMIAGSIEGATSLEIMKSRKVKTVTVLLLIVFLVLILLTHK